MALSFSVFASVLLSPFPFPPEPPSPPDRRRHPFSNPDLTSARPAHRPLTLQPALFLPYPRAVSLCRRRFITLSLDSSVSFLSYTHGLGARGACPSRFEPTATGLQTSSTPRRPPFRVTLPCHAVLDPSRCSAVSLQPSSSQLHSCSHKTWIRCYSSSPPFYRRVTHQFLASF